MIYKVVVNLLPQDATLQEKRNVLTAVHEQRQSVVQSADDAGRLAAFGNSESVVRIWWPRRWSGDIVAYIKKFDVNVEEVEA